MSPPRIPPAPAGPDGSTVRTSTPLPTPAARAAPFGRAFTESPQASQGGFRGASVGAGPSRSASFTVTVIRVPPRRISRTTSVPGEMPATAFWNSLTPPTRVPPKEITMSPPRSPADPAGLPGKTRLTNTPFSPLAPNDSASSGVRSWMPTPSHPRRMVPVLASSRSISRTVLMGIANPIPWPPLTIAVLIPTTSPRVLRRGPPEFPGLMDASGWIRSALGSAGEPDDDLVGVPDDMLVRYDEPVLPDDDAGPEGVLPKPSVLLHPLREIILKARTALRSTRCAPPRKTGDRPEVHHRGHRPLHGCAKPLLHPGDVRGIRGRPAPIPGAGRKKEKPGHGPRGVPGPHAVEPPAEAGFCSVQATSLLTGSLASRAYWTSISICRTSSWTLLNFLSSRMRSRKYTATCSP